MKITAKTGFKLLLSAIVAVLTLEICARLDDYFVYDAPLLAPAYNNDSLYEYDSLGKRGKPNARFRKWSMNNFGYRGPDLRKKGAFRIVCLGASETFGLYEPENFEFPRILERRLTSSGLDVEVVNAALPGMAPPMMTVRIPEIKKKINPHLAIVYVAPANYIWLPWLTPSSSRGSKPRFEWRLREHVETLLKRALPTSLQTWLRERDIARNVKNYGQPIERLPEANVERFRSDLVSMVAELKGVQIEPVLVTHATRFSHPPTVDDRTQLVVWRRFYPMLSEEGFIDAESRMNQVIREVAASQGLTLLDAAAQIPPGDANFADFAHFTEAGSEKMAALLANGIAPLVTRSQNSVSPSAGLSRATDAVLRHR